MSDLVSEEITVETIEGDLLKIWHRRTYQDGVVLGGEFICELSAAEWLAGKLEWAATTDFVEREETSIPPDHFTIYLGGGHGYDDVNVNVHNTRDAELSKTQVLSGLPTTTAVELAARIRAVL